MLFEIQVCQENAELGLLMPIPPDEDQTHIESKFCDQDLSYPLSNKNWKEETKKYLLGGDFLFSSVDPFPLPFLFFF